jgi:hypothetical protein
MPQRVWRVRAGFADRGSGASAFLSAKLSSESKPTMVVLIQSLMRRRFGLRWDQGEGKIVADAILAREKHLTALAR